MTLIKPATNGLVLNAQNKIFDDYTFEKKLSFENISELIYSLCSNKI